MAQAARSDPSSLVERVTAGDRQAVAKLISLVEDGSPDLPPVMAALFPHTGRAHVLGVTGAPGAGKSTLVEGLVARVRAGERAAVLAVDPSSPFTGGAVLGDRVRMQSHATDFGVFIRSMATRGHLGGLTLAAPQAVRVLDAAGYGWVIVETVGVGQAEVDVMEAVDSVVVVVTPGWGDGVQAAKAGLLEIADVFAVNKADRPGARDAVRELKRMIHDGPARPWSPPVLATVATGGAGVDELWAAVVSHRRHLEETGELGARRLRRVRKEIAAIVSDEVARRAAGDSAEALDDLAARVHRREMDPQAAAAALLAKLGLDGP